jgi:hypothetical protein
VAAAADTGERGTFEPRATSHIPDTANAGSPRGGSQYLGRYVSLPTRPREPVLRYTAQPMRTQNYHPITTPVALPGEKEARTARRIHYGAYPSCKSLITIEKFGCVGDSQAALVASRTPASVQHEVPAGRSIVCPVFLFFFPPERWTSLVDVWTRMTLLELLIWVLAPRETDTVTRARRTGLSTTLSYMA